MGWLSRAFGRVNTGVIGHREIQCDGSKLLAIQRGPDSRISRLVYTGLTWTGMGRLQAYVRSVELDTRSRVRITWEEPIAEQAFGVHCWATRFDGGVLTVGPHGGVKLVDETDARVCWEHERGSSLSSAPLRFGDDLLCIFETDPTRHERKLWIRIGPDGRISERNQTRTDAALDTLKKGGVEIGVQKESKKGSGEIVRDGWKLARQLGSSLVWLERPTPRGCELAVGRMRASVLVDVLEVGRVGLVGRTIRTYSYITAGWVDGLLTVRTYLTKGEGCIPRGDGVLIIDPAAWAVLGRFGERGCTTAFIADDRIWWKGRL